MGQLNQINQIGKREDLSDLLVVADAKNTPFTSMCKKDKKPANTIFDWPVGSIPAPNTDSVPDGEPVSTLRDMSGARALLHNRVHKVREVFGVSEMAEDVATPAGVASEFKHSKANAIVTVKRAIEAVFCGTQDSSLSGTTHTTRGIFSWINTAAQTDNPVPAAYRTPAASIYSSALTSLTEDSLRSIMQSIYEQTGQMGDWDGLFGTSLKAAISKMTIYTPDVSTTLQTRLFWAKANNTLEAVIDIVRGDFGQIRLHPTLWNAFNNSTKAADQKYGAILDMNDVSMCANKLPGFKPLPEDDSGPRGVVSAIVGNKVGSPLKHGAIKAS